MKFTNFEKEYIIFGTESNTLAEAFAKIADDVEYQECVIEDLGQETLDFIMKEAS